jgi:hypothetical protein
VNNNYNSNTVVDGRAAHMTDTTRQSAPENPPLPDHAGSIPAAISPLIGYGCLEKIVTRNVWVCVLFSLFALSFMHCFYFFAQYF